MTCIVLAKPCFIYRIKVLYDRYLFLEIASNVVCSFKSLLQCMCSILKSVQTFRSRWCLKTLFEAMLAILEILDRGSYEERFG